jgi:transcriptional regulator with XRE-family HTH domain
MGGSEFRRIRKRLGLSQQRLADALDVHRMTITKYESGTLNVPAVIALLMRLAAKHGLPDV